MERRKREMREKEFEKGKESERKKKAIKIAKECEQEKEIEKEIEKESLKKKQVKKMKVNKKKQGMFLLTYMQVVLKGKVEGEIIPQVLKGKQGKETLAIESRQSNWNAVEKIAGDLVFERYSHFDLVNCHSMISVDDFVPTNSMKSFSYEKFCDGDTLKWFPPKEGGHAINILSFQTISDSHIFGSDFVRFKNKRGCDLERFFTSK
ncbi:hypothetical protein PVK06_035336 [Gossypium arboreum]|uniref:Uncharacterized protein n=1 Tax=Gossypium arboreum TaxID=29729 RepID=A0ABR0NIT7_GOSAR|nr:hypothetical protein PVK06_035336 [Gossypium arboreum]